MQGRFSNMMLVSDVDGTLAPEFNSYPPENVEAVERFRSQGGFFTIATGRPLSAAQKVIDLFSIRGPVILVNGGSIYDTITGAYTYSAYLPEAAAGYLRKIITSPLLLEARVMAEDDNAYSVHLGPNAAEAEETSPRSRHHAVVCDIDTALKHRWRKVLLITREKDADEFQQFVKDFSFPEVDFVASSGYYYEMMPKGVNKGSGMRRAASQLHIPMENTVAAGDYDNDLELLGEAGFSAAPENATPQAKAQADIVLCHCKDGMLAQLVTYLERYKQP